MRTPTTLIDAVGLLPAFVLIGVAFGAMIGTAILVARLIGWAL